MPGVRCAQYTACRSVQLEDELSVSPLRPRQASLSPGKLDALLGSASHETLATNSHRSPVGVIVGAGDGLSAVDFVESSKVAITMAAVRGALLTVSNLIPFDLRKKWRDSRVAG